MKHIQRITQQKPAQAASWQDALCFFATFIVNALVFIGGDAPGVGEIETKCLVPQPNNNQ